MWAAVIFWLVGIIAGLFEAEEQGMWNLVKRNEGRFVLEKTTVRDYCKHLDVVQQSQLFLDKGDTAVLKCHTCNSTLNNPAHWWRLKAFHFQQNSPTKDLIAHATEIDIDLHEDERLNRVFIDDSSSLHLKNIQPGDHGQYFCQQTTSNDELERNVKDACFRQPDSADCHAAQKKLGDFLQQNELSKTQGLLLLINIDVELPPPSIKKVGHHLGLIPQIIKNRKENIMTYSQWSGWTSCDSACNQTGYTRRRGKCVVKRLNRDRKMSVLVDNIMKLNGYNILPCHSTMFLVVPSIFNLPDEMEYKECTRLCTPFPVDVHKMTTVPVVKVLTGVGSIRDVLHAPLGGRLVLKCPAAGVETLAIWFNDSSIIRVSPNDTNKRVDITPENELVIEPIQIWDTHIFACWMRGENRAHYSVFVKGRYIHFTYPQFLQWLKYLIIYEVVLAIAFGSMRIVRQFQHGNLSVKTRLLGVKTGGEELAAMIDEKVESVSLQDKYEKEVFGTAPQAEPAHQATTSIAER